MRAAKLFPFVTFLLLPCLFVLPRISPHTVSIKKQAGIQCLDTQDTLQDDVLCWILDVMYCERWVPTTPRFVLLERLQDDDDGLVLLGYQVVEVEAQTSWPLGTGPPPSDVF